MLELEALDSAGSLISIALAARHLPHTCLKVMKNHRQERALRSGCHLLPANTAHPNNEEKAGNTTQPHQAVYSDASTCFTNDLLSVLKVADILFAPCRWPFICLLVCLCHSYPLSDLLFLFLWADRLGLWLNLVIFKSKHQTWSTDLAHKETQSTHSFKD